MQNEKITDEEKLLESMMYSPSASDADPMLEIDKTTDDDIRDVKNKPAASELLSMLEKGEGKVSEKYRKELLDKALKDPSSIEVETPKGWMTVKDAIGEGFDLTTGEFSNEAIPKVDWEGEIGKLDPREQETIRKLTTPGTRQAGPSAPMPEGEGEPVPEGAVPEGELSPTELPLGGE